VGEREGVPAEIVALLAAYHPRCSPTSNSIGHKLR
jgi:hypothetical protein